MKRGIWLVTVVLAMVMGGCAFIEPHTSVKLNPVNGTVDLYNSKDTSVKAGGVEAVDGEKKFKVETIEITDMSSPVAAANVQQMLAFAEQQRAANEGIAVSLKGVTGAIRELLPFLELTPNTLAAVLRQLKEVDMRIDTDYGGVAIGEAATSQSAKE